MPMMKTRKITGGSLNAAVALALGAVWQSPSARPGFFIWPGDQVRYSILAPKHSTDTAQMAMLIEKNGVVEMIKGGGDGGEYWEVIAGMEDDADHTIVQGPTLLIALCRCLILRKLGEEVFVPQELL